MRNMLLLGTTAIVLTFGALNADAQGGGNLSPEAAPYAILEPQTVAAATMTEGRAAFTDDAARATMQEGRAAYVGGGHWRALGDEGYHHPEDNGYRDPAFSGQQDEAFDGSF